MGTLTAQLQQLENSQLVRPLPEEELVYQFRHALTQESAYESLLLKKRREIHRLVAEAFEQLYTERLDEYAALLAQHYAEAGEEAKTLDYATRAGDAAARMYANTEALIYYARAIEVAKQVSSKTRGENESTQAAWLQALYLKRGRVLELSGKYEEALRNYDELEALAHTLGKRELELAALLARATLSSTPTSVFAPDEGRTLLNRTLVVARELGDHSTEAKVLWNLGLLSWFSGHASESVEYGEQSLELARQYRLDQQVAYALNDLGLPLVSLGQVERARAGLEEARTLWQAQDNKPMLVDNLSASTMVDYLTGDFERVIQGSDQAFQLAGAIGNLWGQSYSRMWVGYVYWERGEVGRAIQVIRDCIDLGEQAGFIAPLITTRADLGWLYASCGLFEQGLDIARLGLEKARQSLQLFTDWGLSVLARINLLKGNLDLAEEHINEVRAQRKKHQGSQLALGGGSFPLAEMELALARGEFAHARDLSDKYIRFSLASHISAALPESLYLKGLALARLGDMDVARSVLMEGRSAAQTLGARLRLWRILTALSELEAQCGKPAEAQDMLAQARAIVAYIAEHMPSDLRAAFVSLPEVRLLSNSTARTAT